MNNDNEEPETITNGSKNPQIVSGLDRPLKTKPIGEQGRAVRRQELMVILGNIGILSAGMTLGLPTVTKRQLTDPDERIYIGESQFSWFASINTLSTPLGGLLSGYLLDKFGRKKTLYVFNILQVIAWVLMASANWDNADTVYIQLLVSRFVGGIACGLASAPVGVYSAEISMPRIRGRLILGTSIAIASGILLIYLLGYFIRNDWHLLAMLSCGYQIMALFCVIPMPESPSWLMSKDRVTKAQKSLNYFRGLQRKPDIHHPEVAAEFTILQKSTQLGEGQKKISFVKALRLPEVYKPLLILMGLFAFQQLSGVFVVIVYAVQISVEAGVTIDPFMCAVLIGLGRVVTTCCMGLILEKWGRRLAGMVSATGMFICMFLLAGQGWWTWLNNVPYLAALAIVFFIVLSTIGIFTLPFFMISELFPMKVRGPASGLTVAVGMFFSFICIKTYPAMRQSIGNQYCFVFYGVMSLLALIFVYLVLPETRGRTLLEIEEYFRNGKKSQLPNKDVEMREVFLK